MREAMEEKGVTFRFGTRVDRLLLGEAISTLVSL